jgi:hypothetical protein
MATPEQEAKLARLERIRANALRVADKASADINILCAEIIGLTVPHWKKLLRLGFSFDHTQQRQEEGRLKQPDVTYFTKSDVLIRFCDGMWRVNLTKSGIRSTTGKDLTEVVKALVSDRVSWSAVRWPETAEVLQELLRELEPQGL